MQGWMIRRWRREAGMTQTQVARLLGVRQSTVSRWERGQEVPGPAMQSRLAKVMAGGLSLSEEHREAAAISTLSIGRALFVVDGLSLMGYSRGFADLWPHTHGGATVDTIMGVPLLDSLVGEIGGVLHDDEMLHRLRKGEFVCLACVTERSTSLEISHGIRYRTHGNVRKIGRRTVIDVTYEVVPQAVPLGFEGGITVEDVLTGTVGGGRDTRPLHGGGAGRRPRAG